MAFWMSSEAAKGTNKFRHGVGWGFGRKPKHIIPLHISCYWGEGRKGKSLGGVLWRVVFLCFCTGLSMIANFTSLSDTTTFFFSRTLECVRLVV